MATFNAINIFGRAVTVNIRDAPRESQETAYAALDGVESTDLGDRGSFATVVGALFGLTAADYADAEALFRSYRDGNIYTLTDNLGRYFERVKLLDFNPTDNRMQFDYTYGFYKRYKAEFRIYDTGPYKNV